MTRIPAARAAATPAGESSNATQSPGGEAQFGGALQESLGGWFAGADLFGGYPDLRHCQARRTHAGLGQALVGRGDQGVRQLCDGPHEGGGSCYRYHAVDIGGLHGEQFGVLGVVLVHRAVGEHFGHGRVALPAVGHRQCVLRIQAVLQRPLPPDALHHGIGIDEGPVHIEQKGAGDQDRHAELPEYARSRTAERAAGGRALRLPRYKCRRERMFLRDRSGPVP